MTDAVGLCVPSIEMAGLSDAIEGEGVCVTNDPEGRSDAVGGVETVGAGDDARGVAVELLNTDWLAREAEGELVEEEVAIGADELDGGTLADAGAVLDGSCVPSIERAGDGVLTSDCGGDDEGRLDTDAMLVSDGT